MTVPTTSRPAVRAGDGDREQTAALLGQGLAQGYLQIDEFEQRLQAAFAAQTISELRALVADLPVPTLRRTDPRRRAARRAAAGRSVHIHLAAYLAMAVVVIAVWLAVALSAGAWYFWPIWPILGGAIGVLGHAVPVRLATRCSRPPARNSGYTHSGERRSLKAELPARGHTAARR